METNGHTWQRSPEQRVPKWPVNFLQEIGLKDGQIASCDIPWPISDPDLIASLEGPTCPCHDDVAPNSIGSCQTGTVGFKLAAIWRFKEFVYTWPVMLKILELSGSHTCVNMFYYDWQRIDCYAGCSACTTSQHQWKRWVLPEGTQLCLVIAGSLQLWTGRKNQTRTQTPHFDGSHGHTLRNASQYLRISAFLTRSTSLYKSNEARPNTTIFFSSEDLCAQNQLLTFLARKPGDTFCSYFRRYSFTKSQLVQCKIWVSKMKNIYCISFTSWSLLNHEFKSVNPIIQARQPICPGNEWPCHRDQCSRGNLWPPVKATWPVQLNLPPFSDPINQW